MVLPSGFGLPPLPHAIGLLVSLAIIIGLLWREHPTISEGMVLAFAPWMVVGAGLHTINQIGGAPASISLLLGTPAVYATTGIGLGFVWLFSLKTVSDDIRQVPLTLGTIGSILILLVMIVLIVSAGSIQLIWSVIGLAIALGLAGISWYGLTHLNPKSVVATGNAGLLVVFGHSLDGVSTAIGVDVLGFGERTPASRAILDFASLLPTAETFGVGWLFVVIKLGVAVAVVWLFTEYVQEDPDQAYILLTIIAAVGVGPGVHNLLLYVVAVA